jgi:hypothetical protein
VRLELAGPLVDDFFDGFAAEHRRGRDSHNGACACRRRRQSTCEGFFAIFRNGTVNSWGTDWTHRVSCRLPLVYLN